MGSGRVYHPPRLGYTLDIRDWRWRPDVRAKSALWGNSIAVRVPRSVAETIDLKPGEDLEIVAVPGGLNIRRPTAPRYPSMSLAAMVAEMDRLGPDGRPDVIDWGPDRGDEIVDDTR